MLGQPDSSTNSSLGSPLGAQSALLANGGTGAVPAPPAAGSIRPESTTNLCADGGRAPPEETDVQMDGPTDPAGSGRGDATPTVPSTRAGGRPEADRPPIADGGRLPSIGPTQQVLIVGDGIAGLATAVYLQRTGHEPVVLESRRSGTVSKLTTVWPSGLALLDRVGLGEAVRDAGLQVDTVTVRPTGSDGEDGERVLAGDETDDVPTLLPTARLVGLLRARLTDATVLPTGLRSLSRRRDALEVEFGTGVREVFDVVVAADGPESVVRSAVAGTVPDWTPLVQTEVDQPKPPGAGAVVDDWQPGWVGQWLPVPGREDGVLRLTAVRDRSQPGDTVAGSPPALQPDADAVTNGDDTAVDLSGRVETTVWQADGPTGAWGDGRVAYVGTAAHPLAPATGLRSALALEDAWVLAEELAHGPRDAVDAIAAYGRRRRGRLQTIYRRASGATAHHGYPAGSRGPLASTGQLRATAIGALCSPALAQLQRDVPTRL